MRLKVAKTDRPKRELEGKLPPLNPSLFSYVTAKKAMVATKNGNSNYCRLFSGFVVKKVTTSMSSSSSMAMVL
jgi:hypothetical protein